MLFGRDEFDADERAEVGGSLRGEQGECLQNLPPQIPVTRSAVPDGQTEDEPDA